MAKTCGICGCWGNHGGERCPLHYLNEQQETRAPKKVAVDRVIARVERESYSEVAAINRAWGLA